MNDLSPERCEVCGASPLERVLHPVAVHYKGSGFYSTDYGRGGKKSGTEGGSETAGTGGGGDGSGGSGSGGSGSGGAGSSETSSNPSSSTPAEA
jgi:hypothetical protein